MYSKNVTPPDMNESAVHGGNAETVINEEKVKNEVVKSELKPDDIVYVTDYGTKYHDKDCITLKSEGIEITLGEAVAEGFEACKTCMNKQ